MKTEFITCFDDISKRTAESGRDAKAYIFLSWLGLTESEMKSAGADDYNAAMRILMCGDRSVYVKEDEIASFLEKCSGNIIGDYDKAGSEADKLGLSHDLVYKMRFFYDKLELKKTGQPEDIVRFKEIMRNIGSDEKTISNEFEQYEKYCG